LERSHKLKTEELDLRRAGLKYGFAISVAFLVVSAGLILLGHDWAGGIIGTVDIVALATVFVVRVRPGALP